MLNFISRRLASSLLVLLLVSLLTFGIIGLVPGDPTAILLDASASPEQAARLRAQLGLDKALPLQMAEWYGRILRGDLGQSILLNRSVTSALLERLPVTLSLAGIALVVGMLLGIAAGIIAAMNHNRWPDQIVMGTALLGMSVPDFWLGLMLVFVFALQFGVLPTGGFVPLQDDAVGWLRTIALPATTLALVHVGFVARMTRAAMLDVLNQDFIRTADAKGLSRGRIVLRHGLPNALIPILTVLGILAGGLLGGTVIIEQVFAIPGVGRLIIGAILSRDFPVIQGGLLFLAVIYLGVNLLVDILYAVADPRQRLQ